jgi:hypothetical protein
VVVKRNLSRPPEGVETVVESFTGRGDEERNR